MPVWIFCMHAMQQKYAHPNHCYKHPLLSLALSPRFYLGIRQAHWSVGVVSTAYTMLDTSPFKETGIDLVDKFLTLVREDYFRPTMLAKCLNQKACYTCSFLRRSSCSLWPLRKIITESDYVLISIFGFRKGTNQIYTYPVPHFYYRNGVKLCSRPFKTRLVR